MSLKEKTATFRCAEPGCREHGLFSYRTQEESRSLADEFRNGWRCSRHRNPEAVLSAENPERVTVLEAIAAGNGATGLFWDGMNGFSFGPGFKAWAKDFPEGTKLIVTARIELPEEGGER